MSQGSHTSPQGKPSAEDLGTADINELAQQFGDVARSLQAHHDGMTAEQAFQALTRVSQNSNKKMRAVAEELTATRHFNGLR